MLQFRYNIYDDYISNMICRWCHQQISEYDNYLYSSDINLFNWMLFGPAKKNESSPADRCHHSNIFRSKSNNIAHNFQFVICFITWCIVSLCLGYYDYVRLLSFSFYRACLRTLSIYCYSEEIKKVLTKER